MSPSIDYRKEDSDEKGSFQGKPDHGFLNEVEAGRQVREICKEHGFTEQRFIVGARSTVGWRLTRQNALRSSKTRKRKLKHVVADLTLDRRALKDIASKKW